MALWCFHLLPLLLSSLLPPSSSAACDFFQGSWVVDEFYPLYNGSSCPFIGFNCLSNGRPDKEYFKYRWKPTACDLPRWDYFQVGDKVVKEMDHMEAYKIALTTWGKWVDSSIDISITKVFFQGVAAVHTDGKEWKDPKAGSCLRQTQPILGPTYPGPSHPGEAIVKSVLSGMEKPVYLLDITLLTQLRKDGHPSIYAGEGPKYNDCSHWCLPGAPDTWNELLYAALL
ncbi:hypothetical protein C1H46_011273 [Malus baccata]|uniref:Trichome birefringence-like C-terminal domain-containing protein n=1 Tax=Malus baccata TaxID=106549 RepID=A0A540MWD3_MALBA|nr:hypothetical protein C1H46_011273 [Malus baccata]